MTKSKSTNVESAFVVVLLFFCVGVFSYEAAQLKKRYEDDKAMNSRIRYMKRLQRDATAGAFNPSIVDYRRNLVDTGLIPGKAGGIISPEKSAILRVENVGFTTDKAYADHHLNFQSGQRAEQLSNLGFKEIVYSDGKRIVAAFYVR